MVEKEENIENEINDNNTLLNTYELSKNTLYKISKIPEILSDYKSGIISFEFYNNIANLCITKEFFTEISFILFKRYNCFLELYHASDEREIHGNFRIYLLFSVYTNQFILITTNITPNDPRYNSLTPFIPAANWFEREINEMFGITPEKHPDLRPLVLHDNYSSDVHPLRKDFQWNSKVPSSNKSYNFRRVEGEGIYEIPVGPVHAGIIEPGHFRFSVAGEPILNLEIRLGYVHKGIEKISEETTYQKGIYLAERISGDNSFSHAIAYCQAVENCAETGISNRAKYLRTIYLELERLYNLFRDIAGISLVTAYNVGAAHCYIIQERIMQLNDYLTGSRFLRNVACLGGVNYDIDPIGIEKIKGELQNAEKELDNFCYLTLTMPSFLDRTQTTGIITQQMAQDLHLVGPVGRASGIERDIRKSFPYAAYDKINFNISLENMGDVQSRFLVKINEIRESIKIIYQALKDLPEGLIKTEIKTIPKGKIGFSIVETPRGEAIHWILAGDGKPFRHKIRDPSFYNWLAMEMAVLGGNGNIVPDFPLINKSMNLSYSGNDL